jgi:hypothetical protein
MAKRQDNVQEMGAREHPGENAFKFDFSRHGRGQVDKENAARLSYNTVSGHGGLP